MPAWTQRTALEELDTLIATCNQLGGGEPHSAPHTQWLIMTVKFLQEVFGAASIYHFNIVQIAWTYHGPMAVHTREMFTPGATEQRYNLPVYQKALQTARGILLAARDELARKGLEEVYQGKDTGPEASLILQVIKLAEVKLRKVLRKPPEKEKEVQDAFENLLIGADIPYSREKDSIEYSSKTYTPDFTIVKADLAIELKLSTAPSHEKEFIAQINDDILAYGSKYGNMFFVVYDCGHIRDVELFISSFESQSSVYVRVVKH